MLIWIVIGSGERSVFDVMSKGRTCTNFEIARNQTYKYVVGDATGVLVVGRALSTCM